MPYIKMRLDYFHSIEKLLNYNMYLRIRLNEINQPEIQLLEYTDSERVITSSNAEQSDSNRILALVREITAKLNDGQYLYPLHNIANMRRKSLDDLVWLGFEISFYKLNDNKILGAISKFYKNKYYDIFITTKDTLKDAFEALDAEIYNKYGYFPGCFDETKENINKYSKKIIKKRRRLERNMKLNF